MRKEEEARREINETVSQPDPLTVGRNQDQVSSGLYSA